MAEIRATENAEPVAENAKAKAVLLWLAAFVSTSSPTRIIADEVTSSPTRIIADEVTSSPTRNASASVSKVIAAAAAVGLRSEVEPAAFNAGQLPTGTTDAQKLAMVESMRVVPLPAQARPSPAPCVDLWVMAAAGMMLLAAAAWSAY